MNFMQRSSPNKMGDKPSPPPVTRKTSLMRRMVPSFRKKPSTDSRFDTLGGVYLTEDCSVPRPTSERSINTIDTQTSHSSGTFDDSLASWNSSGSEGHHDGAPLVVRKAVSEHCTSTSPDMPCLELGDQEILGRIMLKSRKLPQNDGYYASNHVMINNERVKRQVPPLKRMPNMDALAREQARMMAEEKKLFHAEPADIQEILGRECGRRIGENVTRGTNLHAIHSAMMKTVADKNNIMDRRFVYMGIGTARADDGTLYLCQLFRD